MVRSQRLYETNLDFEKVRAAIIDRPASFIFKSDVRLLSFRLKNFPDIPLQLTPKKSILMIHGIKPKKYLLDLKIITKLCSLLKNSFPEALNFKLYGESVSYHDKDEIIEEEKSISELRSDMLLHSEDNKLQDWIDSMWRDVQNNPEALKYGKMLFNQFFAQAIAKNGFYVMPDGSIKLNVSKSGKTYDALLKKFLSALLENGLIKVES